MIKKLLYLIIHLSVFLILNNQIKIFALENTRACSSSSDVCYFGDDYAEIDANNGSNSRVSCLYQGGSKTISWISGKKFFCVAQGVKDVSLDRQDFITASGRGGSYTYRSMWLQGGYTSTFQNYEGWVECDISPTGFTPGQVSSISQLIDFREIDVSGKIGYEYSWKGGSLNGTCRKCGSDFRAVNIQNCPGYFPDPGSSITTSDCTINTNNNSCYFGDKQSSTLNSNCANSSDIRSNRKIETLNGTTYTFFCNSNNDTVRCDGRLNLLKYDDLFTQVTASGGYREYTNFSPTYINKCKLLKTITNSENCELNSTSDSSTSCKFGPFISNTSSQYKNCAVLNEVKNVSGKFVYCAPDSKKIICDTQASYNEIFGPTRTAGGDLDFSGLSSSRLTSSALSKGCKLYTYSAPRGCNVTSAVTTNAECEVPKDCFDQNKLVRTTVAGKDGGLYCISSSSNPLKGFTYFCPFIDDVSGQPYNYSEITRLDSTKVILSGSGRVTSTSDCELYNNSYVNARVREVNPLSPIGLIRSVSNFLFYFAIFYFIVLMLSNAFAYVRSGEDPTALKKIKESLFNTIAGFLFVLASGGVIVYLINQLTS